MTIQYIVCGFRNWASSFLLEGLASTSIYLVKCFFLCTLKLERFIMWHTTTWRVFSNTFHIYMYDDSVSIKLSHTKLLYIFRLICSWFDSLHHIVWNRYICMYYELIPVIFLSNLLFSLVWITYRFLVPLDRWDFLVTN